MAFRGQSTKYKCLENFALYGNSKWPSVDYISLKNLLHIYIARLLHWPPLKRRLPTDCLHMRTIIGPVNFQFIRENNPDKVASYRIARDRAVGLLYSYFLSDRVSSSSSYRVSRRTPSGIKLCQVKGRVTHKQNKTDSN